MPVVQKTFLQRASKDGWTQRGERIVLCWVTGREELRRTSARAKTHFAAFFLAGAVARIFRCTSQKRSDIYFSGRFLQEIQIVGRKQAREW